MVRLKEQYVNDIAPALNKKFGYKSVMHIPKLCLLYTSCNDSCRENCANTVHRILSCEVVEHPETLSLIHIVTPSSDSMRAMKAERF